MGQPNRHHSSPYLAHPPYRPQMMRLLDRVRQTIRRHALARPDTRVVVALSGGSDSVALTCLLGELADAGELRVAGIAHFNHQLRPAARGDEEFSARLAESRGWPVLIDRGDVAARARRERRSIEDAARGARYEFFERARLHFCADCVAVGHTRDDQAETFLLRLLRGAGPRGLAAMHPRSGATIRPLLDCRRADLRAYLAERGVKYVEDESNGDLNIPRNRVRAELLPLLEHRFNPAIVDVLADEATLARDDWRWMEAAAQKFEVGSLKSEVGTEVGTSDFRLQTSHFDLAALNALPLALRRLVLWRAMSDAAGGRPVAFGHVEAAIRLMEMDGDGAIDAPRQRVERVGPRLVLSSRVAAAAHRTRGAAGATNLFHYPLSVPGEVRLPEAGCLVSAEADPSEPTLSGGRAAACNDTTAATAIVRGDLCKGPLAVRNRRPGDRFRPIGLGGRKKLQDFFVDRKVARERRDRVPLVVDEGDRIVWVAGYAIDEAFRVTDSAQAVVILKLKLLGGPD